MKEFWNERYRQPAYAYGEQPNVYLQRQLPTLAPGMALFPAEGEGRNAVFAATLGWQVSAFDISEEGKKKAEQLAQKHGVMLDYTVGDALSVAYAPAQFDALVLIYAHFPAALRSTYHRQLDAYLKPGGIVILEAFSKAHLAYNTANEKVGGPRDVTMLFSQEEIQADFSHYDILELTETEVYLQEGLFHNGLGSVLRFTGRKRYEKVQGL